MDRLQQSYAILDRLRLPHGMYLASPSTDYSYVWLRDSFYESLPFLTKNDDTYTRTYHRILDLFKEYDWKIRIHTTQRPREMWEYIHARYSANEVKEIDTPWGHAQHDAVGAVLFGIAKGIEHGHPIIRNEKDLEIVQLVVDYLERAEYWHDPDNGMWEEYREVHMSSVGAVVAGLKAIRQNGLAHVPNELIIKGEDTLNNLFPFESVTKPVDLAQLSLIYPYSIYTGKQAEEIINRVETMLLRKRGVLRYQGDSYYSTKEHLGRHLPFIQYYGTEAEWTFGLPWLALTQMSLGDTNKADKYIKQTENVMLEDGSLPELYLSNSESYNGNTPLGWSNAMYILAKEQLNSMGVLTRT